MTKDEWADILNGREVLEKAAMSDEVTDNEVNDACYHIDGDYYGNSYGTSKTRMKRALQAFLKSRSRQPVATSDLQAFLKSRSSQQPVATSKRTGLTEYPKTAQPVQPAPSQFKRGDLVRKRKGSEWDGSIVGFYSTELTPEGYAVESSTHAGSVQIYPAAALELTPPALAKGAKPRTVAGDVPVKLFTTDREV